jgi:hypothetical protein
MIARLHALLAVVTLCHLGCSSGGAAMCSPQGGLNPASDGCDAIACGVTDTQFPTFDKTCTTAADCAIGVHQTDCCGSTIAIGLARVDQVRFAADEQVCAADFPKCACPERATAEDGQSTLGKAVVVACQASRCMTAAQ